MGQIKLGHLRGAVPLRAALRHTKTSEFVHNDVYMLHRCAFETFDC